MTPAASIHDDVDTRPHPLGLAEHRDWDAVRLRWHELRAWALVQPAQPAVPFHQTLGGNALIGAALMAGVIALAWVAGLAVA